MTLEITWTDDAEEAYQRYTENMKPRDVPSDLPWRKIHFFDITREYNAPKVRKIIRRQVKRELEDTEGIESVSLGEEPGKRFQVEELAAIHEAFYQLNHREWMKDQALEHLGRRVEELENQSRLQHLKKAVLGK